MFKKFQFDSLFLIAFGRLDIGFNFFLYSKMWGFSFCSFFKYVKQSILNLFTNTVFKFNFALYLSMLYRPIFVFDWFDFYTTVIYDLSNNNKIESNLMKQKFEFS